jgi:DNA-nicking Smr family endonuclease
MKPKHKKHFHRPFDQLKTLVKNRCLEPEARPEPAPSEPSRLTQEQENDLFTREMADVTPLEHNTHWRFPDRRSHAGTVNRMMDMEEEGRDALERLIHTGEGFIISQTDEYMEARGPGVNPRVVKRLHQGRYSIQDHIDLHGWFAREAESILHRFIRNSLRRDYQAVLIIHGRGLKSPHQPVLKNMVLNWLTRGPLRAYVIALTSARACDGGAGATYVLLRRRPIGKRQRKTDP